MSFNMSALRASVGSIPVRRPLRTVQRPVSASCMPAFTGLSISGRLSMQSEGKIIPIQCHVCYKLAALPDHQLGANPRSAVLFFLRQ